MHNATITIAALLSSFCGNETATLEINDGRGIAYNGTYGDFAADPQNAPLWYAEVGAWSVTQDDDAFHFTFNI